uniref:Retrovirus-related Pol polyprotein from transposon TNT 1-94 n=1 Tax=Tanacetum cinerariifolium TaxID=118510 RepID=A0A6L2KY46_TANCI|nr:retrovirus-related Pol polyprotein from transposon TNT 1-94 [Tanacetum cinerariifolium]
MCFDVNMIPFTIKYIPFNVYSLIHLLMANANALNRSIRNYPECEICGSYDHFTSEHNRVIQIRGGVLAESSQSSKSSIGVSCTTYGSSVHLTTDHNDLEHFKREQPGHKVVFDDNSSCIIAGYGLISCGGIVFSKDRWSKDQHIKLVNIIGDLGEGMLTRSMASKLITALASKCLFANFLSEIEPKKVSEALKHPGWTDAMQEKLNQFYRNKVRTLVLLPYGKIAIGSKWVFRNKKDEHEIVTKNKERLVTQGYSQEERINYDKTFAPVARMEAIKIFLAFATYMNFIVFQMDVKSDFLNGKLKEEVYVNQPPSFKSSEFPNYCQPMDQNINSSSFDQIQPPQYPVIQHPSQEMSEEILQAKENLMKSIQTFLKKFNRISFGEMPKVLSRAWEKCFEIQHAQPEDTNELLQKLLKDLQIISEELAVYINSPSWNHPTFYNNDEQHSIQYKEYLKNSSNVITTVLPTKEPKYSLSMRDEHLSTIPKIKSDEVIKSSVKNLVQIPSEYEVTSNNESDCDVQDKDESSSIFTKFSNLIFDYNNDFTSKVNSNKIDPHYFNAESDIIESLSNRDTLFDSSPKFDYLKEFSGELMPISIINKERIKREHEEYIILMEKLLTINSFPRPMENFHANTIIKAFPTSPIPVEDSETLRKEINIFTGMNDFMPSGIKSDDYDSERDIHFLEELLSNDSISLLENESSNFDYHDDLSFPRPPSKPLDIEIFFKPDSGVLTTNVVKGISEHCVLMHNILPTLPTFDPLYSVYDTLLLFSSENKDKVFKPGILSYLLVSHRDKTTFDFSKNPMMMYGGDIPSKVISDLHTIPMDK